MNYLKSVQVAWSNLIFVIKEIDFFVNISGWKFQIIKTKILRDDS